MGTHPIFESDFDCLTDTNVAIDHPIRSWKRWWWCCLLWRWSTPPKRRKERTRNRETHSRAASGKPTPVRYARDANGEAGVVWLRKSTHEQLLDIQRVVPPFALCPGWFVQKHARLGPSGRYSTWRGKETCRNGRLGRKVSRHVSVAVHGRTQRKITSRHYRCGRQARVRSTGRAWRHSPWRFGRCFARRNGGDRSVSITRVWHHFSYLIRCVGAQSVQRRI